jgi:hypothetical protein
VIALLECCVIGLVVSNNGTNAIQRPSPEQKRILALAEQLSSLSQTDLILFPDGRVWCVHYTGGTWRSSVGLNVYGSASSKARQQANLKVVQMVIAQERPQTKPQKVAV